MELQVWILDSNRENAMRIANLWQLIGGKQIKVTCFAAEEVMRRANNKQPPDLIMGELTEVEWIRRNYSADLIAVTADRRSSTFTRLQRCGMIDIVLKPYAEQRIIRSIRHYLELRSGFARGDRMTQRDLDRYFFPVGGKERGKKSSFQESSRQQKRQIRILQLVTMSEPAGLSSEELIKKMGLSRSTVLKEVDYLIQEELLWKADKLNGKKGRPKRVYHVEKEVEI